MGTQLVTASETAKILGVCRITLARWRGTGQGPRFVRFGGPRGRAMYSTEAIAEWVQDHSAGSTSEEAVREAKQ
jgi:hypothetical protein